MKKNILFLFATAATLATMGAGCAKSRTSSLTSALETSPSVALAATDTATTKDCIKVAINKADVKAAMDTRDAALKSATDIRDAALKSATNIRDLALKSTKEIRDTALKSAKAGTKDVDVTAVNAADAAYATAVNATKVAYATAVNAAKASYATAVNAAKYAYATVIQSAKHARDAALESAKNISDAALDSAKYIRDAALEFAKAGTKNANITAINAANDAYTTAVNAAKDAGTTSVNAANDAYAIAAKPCSKSETTPSVSLGDYKKGIFTTDQYKNNRVTLEVMQIKQPQQVKVFSIGTEKCVSVDSEFCTTEMVKNGNYLDGISLLSDAKWSDGQNHEFYLEYVAEGGPVYFGPYTDNVLRLKQESAQDKDLIK